MNLIELGAMLHGHDETQHRARRAIAGKHIYAGTVPHKEVQRRRAANKVARRSRRVNRARR